MARYISLTSASFVPVLLDKLHGSITADYEPTLRRDGLSCVMLLLKKVIMTRWDILINLINENGYRNIAEIGIYRGKTVRKILAACELDVYFLVDPIWQQSLSHYLSISGNAHIACYLIRTSEKASSYMNDQSLDLVFLDALHTKQDVLDDISHWQPKIRSGGVLCGDDYDNIKCPGVKQAVDEVFGDSVELVEIGRKGVKIWLVKL